MNQKATKSEVTMSAVKTYSVVLCAVTEKESIKHEQRGKSSPDNPQGAWLRNPVDEGLLRFYWLLCCREGNIFTSAMGHLWLTWTSPVP